jgi:hypothetical protein
MFASVGGAGDLVQVPAYGAQLNDRRLEALQLRRRQRREAVQMRTDQQSAVGT